MLILANAQAQNAADSHWIDMFASTWWFLLALILPLIATIIVQLTFAKYNKTRSIGGRTAAEIAREMLDANELRHVQIVQHPGKLSDHYDPRTQIVALSESVHDKDTIGAIAVAAHEVGHAIQHATGYAPIKVRHAIFPVVSFGSKLWVYLFIAGMALEVMNLIWAAIALFAFGVLFQLITLPLEIDASRRALNTITAQGYLIGPKEVAGARKTLTAAAFTYVVALLASVIQLLRLVAISRRRR